MPFTILVAVDDLPEARALTDEEALPYHLIEKGTYTLAQKIDGGYRAVQKLIFEDDEDIPLTMPEAVPPLARTNCQFERNGGTGNVDIKVSSSDYRPGNFQVLRSLIFKLGY